MADEQITDAGENNPADQTETGAISEVINDETAAPEEVEISDEVALKAFNKKFGKEFKSFDEIKFPETEVSTEEKEREITTKEKKLFDRFTQKQNGTIDQFANLKKIANADVADFSMFDLKNELRAEGIAEEDLDQVIKDRYYLLTEDEKAALDPEDPFDAALLKKNEIFSKKLANRGVHKIKDAQGFFARLSADIEAEDLLIQTDAKISSTVDEYAKRMDRKIKVDLGKSNDIELSPVEFNIEDADIADTIAMLKDPAQRNKFLYNPDGSENVENLFEALKWKAIANSLVKKAAIQGATEQVQYFQSIYPNNIQSVAPGSVPRRQQVGGIGKAIEGTEKISYTPSSR